jgi:DnaJ-class molecular chaperone
MSKVRPTSRDVKTEICPSCKGAGYESDDANRKCPNCAGGGKIYTVAKRGGKDSPKWGVRGQ